MNKSLFIWIPRTAGTSIWMTLCAAAKKECQPTQWIENPCPFDHDAIAVTFSHHPYWYIEAYLDSIGHAPEDFFTFAFARNPWARLVSLYHYCTNDQERRFTMVLNGLNFYEFARKLASSPVVRDAGDPLYLFGPQVNWVFHTGAMAIDLVARYESLDTDWAIVENELGFKRPLIHESKGRYKPYRSYYDADLRDAVGDYYSEDVRAFGYTF